MDMEKVKVVYIAGKITGEPDLGKEKFDLMEARLRKRGLKVINPTLLPVDLPPESYLPICLQMINQSDAVILLDNWQDSKGANIERLYAKYCGKVIIYPKKKKSEAGEKHERD